MKFYPIFFSTEMVQAILEGRKTQTRRVVKGTALEWLQPDMFTPEFVGDSSNSLCPYGNLGDVLWVRETWAPALGVYAYKADYTQCTLNEPRNKGLWKPSIHMPKEAARLFLQIKSVRVERLNDISEEDAIAEGVEFLGVDDNGPNYKNYTHGNPLNWYGEDPASGSFRSLWSSIYGDRYGTHSWQSNPWVWVIEFEPIQKPNNFLQP